MTTPRRRPAALTVPPVHYLLWPLDAMLRSAPPCCDGPHGRTGDGTYARAVGSTVVELRTRGRAPLALTVRVYVCQACADRLRLTPGVPDATAGAP